MKTLKTLLETINMYDLEYRTKTELLIEDW